MVGSRRPHTKSRKGCRECKRRKVKCDEIQPSCFNCTRYGVTCHYGPDTPKPDEVWDPSADSTTSTVTAGSPAVEGNPACHSSAKSFSLNRPDSLHLGHAWGRDLELMHHYCTATSDTMATQEAARHVWRVLFPQEGYANEYVMHGVLSLAALHKAFLIPDRRDIYLTRSAFHHSMGQQHFTTLLSDVNVANWRSVFCFATMVIAYVLSMSMQPDDESEVKTTAILRTLELISVTKGVKAILLPFIPQLNKTNLAPLVTSVWLTPVDPLPDPKPSLEYSLIPSDVYNALSRLRRFLTEHVSLKYKGDYEKAVTILEVSAVQIAYADVNVEVGAILLWPFFLPEIVVSDIKDHKPQALLILAYYAVFVNALDRVYWFLRGWGRKLLKDINDQIEAQEPCRDLLDWPHRHICE
ncbi:uncharacterized protein F4812DRAFT_439283 [Daldinia caldariorum]|uniref:uncharacterized protein n=1 Tax=Daldinia caldariorum TaxID=326644 RepID=UPI0020088600|nr:uncharacterized protein F4812DRAFT_439283 [Daldinia caldariorum]KAI1465554.1 hypothetical protein F4812DRAFT_439283 [Daldinia caldariorum]